MTDEQLDQAWYQAYEHQMSKDEWIATMKPLLAATAQAARQEGYKEGWQVGYFVRVAEETKGFPARPFPAPGDKEAER
jgi:hypothetical protein